MNDALVVIKHLSDLRDLAHNIAGLSDDWLDYNATKPDRLLQLIHEYRRQAREALGK
jgi:hypothetical protein